MRLTKKNLTVMRKAASGGLEKYVLDYVIGRWDDYDDKAGIFTDVLWHGCQSGVVGSLIYYSDTVRFFERHKEEIGELLHEALWECGTNDPKDLFGDKWDEEDPLALDACNQNLLAWFGFEEAMRKIAYEFEELEEKI